MASWAGMHGALRLQGKVVAALDQESLEYSPWHPRVFIGHGRSPLWLKVKEVADKDLGLIPIATNRSRARDSPSCHPPGNVWTKADFASWYDGRRLDGEGDRRPRQNVVHEGGPLPGAPGLRRTVLLVEKGVEF